MSSSTLAIDGRIVSRSEGGALETEYALFDPHEIELRSNNEPGTVREDGYRTTVSLAKERLELDGITGELAGLILESMRPALLQVYARGPLARRFAQELDAALAFQTTSYDAKTKTYHGLWLDLAALGKDAGVERATAAFQAVFLAALIADLSDDTPIYLSTADYTKDRRPGERTHRRVVLMQTARLPEAIRSLAAKGAPGGARDAGVSRADLLQGLRTRYALATESSRGALLKLEQDLTTREQPTRGPLADPELWALETRLSAGDATGVLEKIDAIERARGRQPSTAYLRARASLLLGTEDAKVVADRASALALSMSTFAELELLAAEAWEKAGEIRRALPYARDLAGNAQVHEDLRAKADAIVKRAEGGRPQSIRPVASSGVASGSMAAAPARPSAQFPRTPTQPPAHDSAPPDIERDTMPVQAGVDDEPTVRERIPSARPPAPSFFTSSGADPVSQSAMRAQSRVSQPMLSATQRISQTAMPLPETRSPSQAPRGASSPPPSPPRAPRTLSPPPPPMSHRPSAPSSPSAPGSLFPVSTSSEPPPMPVPLVGSVHPPPLRSVAPMTTRSGAPPGFDPRREPEPEPPPIARPPSSASLPPRPPDTEPPDSEPPNPLMKGASQPPFRSDAPPSSMVPPPEVPREPRAIELASTLSMPAGAPAEATEIDGLPTTIASARVYFTQLSRELGAEYKKRYGIELRTDVRSIEIMQRHLKERFPEGQIESEEDALEVRRHGAFLSEILARTLGAEWVDIALTEVGYWSMIVPPGTLVWPFGRVLRLVAMQHKERDLVSYYLELQARQMRR